MGNAVESTDEPGTYETAIGTIRIGDLPAVMLFAATK
jgi:hypothetical protein